MKISLVVLVVLIVAAVAWWHLAFPGAQATARVTAIVRIDGRELTSSAVWRVQTLSDWGLDAGTNYRSTTDGDAIVFDLGSDEALFLSMDHFPLEQCARTVSPSPSASPVAAVNTFRSGGCDIQNPSGEFFHASQAASHTPALHRFYWSNGALMANTPKGTPADPFLSQVAARGFALLSMHVEATTDALGSDILARYPWILDLHRDPCGPHCGMHGGTNDAANFTTLLR